MDSERDLGAQEQIEVGGRLFTLEECGRKLMQLAENVERNMQLKVTSEITVAWYTGGTYKDGPENIFFCKSVRARKFWTALIGRARQKHLWLDEPLIFLARPYKRRHLYYPNLV